MQDTRHMTSLTAILYCELLVSWLPGKSLFSIHNNVFNIKLNIWNAPKYFFLLFFTTSRLDTATDALDTHCLFPSQWVGRLTCWVAMQTALYSPQWHLSPMLGAVGSSRSTIYWEGSTTVETIPFRLRFCCHMAHLCLCAKPKQRELMPKAEIISVGMFFVLIVSIFKKLIYGHKAHNESKQGDGCQQNVCAWKYTHDSKVSFSVSCDPHFLIHSHPRQHWIYASNAHRTLATWLLGHQSLSIRFNYLWH